MSKRQILMLLGAWIIAFLFLGFYSTWDKIFAIATGVLIIGISYSMKPEGSALASRLPFVEHRGGPGEKLDQKTEASSDMTQPDIINTNSSMSQ